MSVKTGACCIGSILLCIFLGYSFYHLVAKRGLGNRGDSDESSVDTNSPAAEIGQTDTGSFRMVENINFPSDGYSIFSILAFLVVAAISGVLLWCVYQKYLDWRASRDTPPDLEDIEPRGDPPPSYSRAERDADRERHMENQQRSRPSHGRRHRRWRRAHQEPEDDPEAPCPHPYHYGNHHEDDGLVDDQAQEYIRMQRRPQRGSGASSPMSLSPSQQQIPLASRPRMSDTEVRNLWMQYFNQGHIYTTSLPTSPSHQPVRPSRVLHNGRQLCVSP
jgi:hypothetical protein